MQVTDDLFTSTEKLQVRHPKQRTLISWKKNYSSAYTFFTIGVSLIGGNDLIKGNNDALTQWDKYDYDDETSRVINLSYEREMTQPVGAMFKAMADVTLDNYDNRFTRSFDPDIGTSLLPMRPIKIATGFKQSDGLINTIMQFIGLTSGCPTVDIKDGTAKLHAEDFLEYLWEKKIADTSMFTSKRSDWVIEQLLINAGFATSQYDLDLGSQIIPFGMFEKDETFGNYIQQICEAEMANFYQDENGILKFENREHWANSPYDSPIKSLYTSDVLDVIYPDEDTVINYVEIEAYPREVQDDQPIWSLDSYWELLPNTKTEKWIDFEDPIYLATTPTEGGSTSNYIVTDNQDGTGTDYTSSVNIKSFDCFSKNAKIVFENTSSKTLYVTTFEVYGRPAKLLPKIYISEKRSSSYTANQPHPYKVENDFISLEYARSLAQMILERSAFPEDRLEITIKAMPDLQLGDMISYSGRWWQIFGLSIELSPSGGFVQNLKLLKRTIAKYFRIGVSEIGGTDIIAP